jgi:hypothetical protein
MCKQTDTVALTVTRLSRWENDDADAFWDLARREARYFQGVLQSIEGGQQ